MPHLDGLRAVSVLAILTFHLRPDWLPGGFLGVDVFFIISGFLITSLLLDEVQNHGRIDFLRFYRRRFKRLFPSFILVILLTMICAYILFDQQKFISVAKTALFSVFGISNLYFYKTASYFDLSSIEKPLLHIWSLSVEEQFYFIWPLVLFVMYKFVLRSSKYFYLLVATLFLLTVYFNLNHPVATFYLPFSRFYEFLVGAGLALFPWKQGAFHKHARTCFLASLITLPIIFLMLDSTSLLPGPASFLFIFPVVYLITNGGIESKLNILNLKFFKYIGKRSYTIYLIHWPIIVFYLDSKSIRQMTFLDTIVIALSIFILADVIYRCYEYPLRVSGNRSKTFLIIVVAISILVVSISTSALVLNKKPFSPGKSLVFTQSDIDAGKQFRFSDRLKICEAKGWENCDKPQPPKFRALILGDSHAIDALNAMYSVFPEIDYSMSQLGGCPPTNRMNTLVPRTFPDLDKCIELNQTRFSIDYLNNFDVIVINVLFGWYPPEELQSYLTFLHETGVQKVVVFGDYFETKTEVPLIINRFGFNELPILAEIIPKIDSDSSLQTQTSKYNFFFVSKRKSLCPISECTFWKSGIPYTWDNHHLSYEFAQHLLDQNKNELKEYLSR